MATNYWYAGESGESYTEQTKHADRDCHHLEDADNVRPISSELVDEDETCGVCSGSFRSDPEDSDEVEESDSDEVTEDDETDETDEE